MIIGFTGKLESGKTTTANYIKEFYPNTTVIAFADLLKEMIYNAGLCTKKELWGTKTKFSRLMMQKIGTEIIRKQVDDNFWVNEMKTKIENIKNVSSGKLIVIHDVRFLNECDMVRFFDGKIIRIIRPDHKNNFIKKWLKKIRPKKDHLSETEQDSIVADFEIINDGTLEELKIKVKNTLYPG